MNNFNEFLAIQLNNYIEDYLMEVEYQEHMRDCLN